MNRPLQYAASLVLLAGQGLADSSGEITVKGIVPEICELAIDADDAILDLGSGVSGVAIATVTETCNLADGYVVTVHSSHDGALVQGGTALPYQATYGGVALDLSGSASVERGAPEIGAQRQLVVSLPPSGNVPSGLYQDTITVEITAQ